MEKVSLNEQDKVLVTEDVYRTAVWAVEEKMRANAEVKTLRAKMAENNKTFFDKKKEVAFQDDYGKDGVMFNEKYYKDYQNVLKNYDLMFLDLNNQKNAIKSKFGFGKKKKLEEVDRKIDELNEKMDVYCEIRNREEIFEKTWQKDGKFFDLNKDFKAQENEIRKGYIKEAIKEIFENHPEYIMLDFSKESLPKDVIAEINNYQKKFKFSSKNTEKQTSKKEQAKANSEVEPERE